jgi:hypothetical protein
MTQQTEITKEQILKDLKSKLREYENKSENLRYERHQISFSIKNCDQLDYTFEKTALRLKHEQTDAKIWIIDDIVSYLNNLIEDLEKLKIKNGK